MDALKFYKKHSQAELVDLARRISEDPANLLTLASGIYLHKSAARKRLAKINAAIAWHMEDARAASGRPVPVCGYIGRKSNRGA